ncbi:AraC family transcriptional regulator [Tropicibacter naphthalenivorans]|uniref:DNA gyrase inhibitor n=1 Tax=Tropicibacter naphthalenivorans TaxID=441103 RepID=A0A0P1G2E3_9RHOB|nr:GyrI-like domain-containing protein [Tropicibacter naphthalenivorans]CUH75957.1 DNA gyrase inhibitor [Tropicibacter naphthalenivorans]SMC41015.1 GyrI-like small molecule binding domain-containing protein [Tropicibacter naphthalenivorans]
MPAFDPSEVQIIDFPETPVAVLTHRGAPASVGASVQRFIGWRKANGLPPAQAATFNVFHSDPRTSPQDFRLDICCATTQPIAPNAACVRCAYPKLDCCAGKAVSPAVPLGQPQIPRRPRSLHL